MSSPEAPQNAPQAAQNAPQAAQNAAIEAIANNTAPAGAQKKDATPDPRMSMGAISEMPTMDCFPGATPAQIVSTEEALFGYENFGTKYTAQGCAACGKKAQKK